VNINLHLLYVLDCNVHYLLWLYVSIVSLLLSSCICLYSAHLNMQDPWVGGRYYVSMVLRYCLSVNVSYTPGRVVDRGCDRPIESYVVHPPCVGLVEPDLKGGEDYVFDPP
jgi:hypothetical protein